MYIYQHYNWPNFTWDNSQIIDSLSLARNLQGRIIGKMESFGFQLRDEAILDTLTIEVLKSTEIEGEFFSLEEVRSSVARHLGLDFPEAILSSRNVDGMVEMVLDAVKNSKEPLDNERLFSWYNSLFPTGRSGLYKIDIANWRTDSTGPMQVVSGAMGREKVHFQAPKSEFVQLEMNRFFDYFNAESEVDLLLKAAVVHLWFLTIHPFEDGNGRIARALTDMILTQSDSIEARFYSMSAQIRIERKEYYEILEKTQKGDLDITNWVQWFLNCLINALKSTDVILNRVLRKANFWQKHNGTILNERQIKLINKLLDGFDGKLTSSKWAKIAKCSKDSAVRDINDLIDKQILQKEQAGGRSTNYELK